MEISFRLKSVLRYFFCSVDFIFFGEEENGACSQVPLKNVIIVTVIANHVYFAN